ncbi:MAG: trehalose-6-phosphate synthase, partial [Syntrophomonadaceae bacterium]|nr:trehalose-6-phosphate synthase [Syntrophomonadaceae bacterium]
MNSNEVLADFQILGSRVSKLLLDTRIIDEKGRADVSFDFDYEMGDVEEEGNRFQGILKFIVQVKAKVKNKILFKIELEMEEFELGDEIVAVGVDRIDYTKGIIERILAIDRFLEKYPEYKKRFVFIQLAAPSRTHIKRY